MEIKVKETKIVSKYTGSKMIWMLHLGITLEFLALPIVFVYSRKGPYIAAGFNLLVFEIRLIRAYKED